MAIFGRAADALLRRVLLPALGMPRKPSRSRLRER